MKGKIFITLGLIVGWWVSLAQTFPVQVSTVITPPYSPYLSDYVSTDKLAVHLLFNDPVRVELGVKLKLTIEAQGITITTKPEFNPRPIYLQSGFAERLSGADLAAYFDPRNLNFQGLDRQQLEKTGALPEGVYRICIDVYEYGQNKKVSNSGCVVAWMILNDPPVINYPKNGEVVKILDPQLVIFNWTPRHTGSPNAAFNTEYEFELVEVRSGDHNPNNAILTSMPILKTTTTTTSLYYDIMETPLIPGQQYAFRVKAKALAGVDELNLFKNQGYSEVFTFTYGSYCPTPNEIKVNATATTRVEANWVSLPGHTSFITRYRENKDKSEWFEKNGVAGKTILEGLTPNTEYFVQVVGYCDVIHNDNVQTYSIKTPDVIKQDFACGAPGGVVKLDNQTLVKSLTAGYFIESSNFMIGLIEVADNGNGTFSGRGIAYMPWLKFAGLKVEFKDIKVNTDKKVIAGNVLSTQSGNSKWVFTVPSIPVEQPKQNDPAKGTTTNNTDPTQADIPVVQISGTIDTVTKDKKGNILVKDKNGNITTIADKKVIIKDSSGNSYTSNGKDSEIVNTTGKGTGDAVPGSNTPTQNSSDLKGDLEMLKKALAQIKTQTDFAGVSKLNDDLTLKAAVLKESITKERQIVLQNAPSTSDASLNDAILIHEDIVDLKDNSQSGNTFKAYKEFEKAYNKLRILQIICREGITEEELILLRRQLVVDGKSLDKFIAASKTKGNVDNAIVDSIAKAIITLAGAQS